MNDRRIKQRRKFVPATRFPLYTREGNLIIADRSSRPTRRINDIEVKELGYREFIAELQEQGCQDQLVFFDIETPLIGEIIALQ